MLVPIPALTDNYIWLYGRENLPVLIVDIPETAALLAYLQQHRLNVEALLLTHHHADHVGGLAAFRQAYPAVPVYASVDCAALDVNHILNDGEISTPHYRIQVIPSGGHTEHHISYLIDGHLFCGDALFSAGCGRVFTGDYGQMFATLQRFKQLDDETIVCPGHEYTLSNLVFAEQVLPNQSAVKNQRVLVARLRAENRSSLPSTMALERQINPFLQADTLAEFTALRQAKDHF